MIEFILPGNIRVRRDSTEAPVQHIIRGLIKDYKLGGDFTDWRLRGPEGVQRGNKKMSSIPDGTTLKLEKKG